MELKLELIKIELIREKIKNKKKIKIESDFKKPVSAAEAG
jgi:hypothetical protein